MAPTTNRLLIFGIGDRLGIDPFAFIKILDGGNSNIFYVHPDPWGN